MSQFDLLIEHPLVERLAWTLLHFLWQGAVVAGACAMALSLARGRDRRYLAGCGALAAMLALPPLTFLLLTANSTGGRRAEGAAAPAVGGESGGAEPAPLAGGEALPRGAPAGRSGRALHAPDGVDEDSALHAPYGASSALRLVLPAIVGCWLGGVLVLGLRLATAWIRQERMKRAARPVEGPWLERFQRLAARLRVGRTVRLLRSARAQVPISVGWLRPIVLLPASALTGVAPGELEAILAHELAHVRRWDYLVNLLQRFAETVLFYHPAVWWVSRRLDADREYACDDLVLETCGRRSIYAKAIVAAAGLRVELADLAPAVTGGRVTARVRRIMGLGEPREPLGAGWCFAVLGVVGVAGIVSLTGSRGSESRAASRDGGIAIEAAADSDVPHLLVPLASAAVPFEALNPGGEFGREVVLPAGGRLAFSSRMDEGEVSETFRIRVARPGPVAVTVISLTEGFRPFLWETWQTAERVEGSNTEADSGPGGRPLDIVAELLPEPHNWLGLDVRSGPPGAPPPEMGVTTYVGHYVICVWQAGGATDRDADVIGIESSPIVLDASGTGVLPQPHMVAPPAIDFAGDVDVFQVRVGTSRLPGGTMTITAAPQTAGLGLQMTVFDASGEPLASAASAGDGDCAIALPVEAGELVYFAVAGVEDGQTGAYTLRVRGNEVP